jgi:hypothetical protein
VVENNYTVSDVIPAFAEFMNEGGHRQSAYEDKNLSNTQSKISSTGRDSYYSPDFFKYAEFENPDQIIQDVQGPINGLLDQVMLGRSKEKLPKQDYEKFKRSIGREQTQEMFYRINNDIVEFSDIVQPISSFEMMAESMNQGAELYHLDQTGEIIDKAIDGTSDFEYGDLNRSKDRDLKEYLEQGKEVLLDDLSDVSTALEIAELGNYDESKENRREGILDLAESIEGVSGVSTLDPGVLDAWVEGSYEKVIVHTPKMLERIMKN